MLWRFLGQIASISKKIFTVAFRLLFEICLLLFWWSCGVQCFWLGKGSVKASCNFSLHLFRGALWSIKLCGEFPRLLCLIILRPQLLFTFFFDSLDPPLHFSSKSPQVILIFASRFLELVLTFVFKVPPILAAFVSHFISSFHFIAVRRMKVHFISFHCHLTPFHFISSHE